MRNDVALESRTYPVPPENRGAGVENPLALPASIENLLNRIESYGREQPLAFAAWMFGIGFVLGWKLKPW